MVKLKNFFIKAGLWFKNHAPTKRRLIQIYAALLYNANIKGFVTGNIYQGATKNACVPGLNCYSCPGAVGACPLGALQDSMAQSGERAPYYIIGILALFGLILGRTICGFLCPVGLGQELLYKIKTPKLKKSRYTRLLSYFKYVLLVVLVIAVPLIYAGIPAFCKYVCPAGTFEGAVGLLSNPNNQSYFDMLDYLFSWKFILLVVFVVASVFVFRFFCRFICPLGAIYSFFNKFALIGVKLDNKKCVDCGACIQTCKMDIRHVGDNECINCGECIPVCPTKAISWKGSKLVLAGIDTSVLNEKPQIVAATIVEANVEAEPEVVPPTREEKVKAVEAKIKKRSFWLQFTAWALAVAVLIGALVYYNFFDVTKYIRVYYVGDVRPEMTFDTVYDTAGAYRDGEKLESVSLSDFEGKVVVLNFWFTRCDPCVEEIPDFNIVKEEFGDSVEMIIVHSDNGTDGATVQERIAQEDARRNKEDWTGYNLIFTHDTKDINCISSFGGGDVFPMTVIINAEGVITFKMSGSLSSVSAERRQALLRSEINNALNGNI